MVVGTESLCNLEVGKVEWDAAGLLVGPRNSPSAAGIAVAGVAMSALGSVDTVAEQEVADTVEGGSVGTGIVALVLLVSVHMLSMQA